MDDETLILTLCEITGRLPSFAWRADGSPYAADEIGVFYGAIGSAPDRAVGIELYSAIDEEHLLSRRVQFYVRGRRHHRRDADRIADVLFTVFDRRVRGDGIASIRRTSVARLGADDNGREERAENYLITLDNLEASS